MSEVLDLLVVGACPTGIAIGAEAIRRGVGVLVMDRGPLTAAIQGYPTFMEFFTTRDRLEIADIPFTIPDDKPTRRQALAYYRLVTDRYRIPLALYEEVLDIRREGEGFTVTSNRRELRARAVAVATGYFGNPRRLGVPGEDLPWVSARYKEAYPHYRQDVVIVGAGNTAAEAALDLWRNGARVTLVHRGQHVKPGVKYWVKP
ncbi:MAG TPA: NAD(P)-binding domain-containing protein, partial [Thermoanaerobaculia bacterium]